MKNSLNNFLRLCHSAESIEELEQLFDLFLTLEEKQILASRYEIIRALLKGDLPQREIAKHYKVSIAQITRGSNALKLINTRLKNFLLSFWWR
jgi:TrpR family transcriptional regulator, trp operon repressor